MTGTSAERAFREQLAAQTLLRTLQQTQDPRLAGVNPLEAGMVLQHATVDELIAAHAAGLPALGYGAARQLGVPHDDVLAAAAAGADPYEYATCRRAGDDHAESLTGLAAIPGYARWRKDAASHAVVVTGHACGLTRFALPGVQTTAADLVAGGADPDVVAVALRLFGGDYADPVRIAEAVPQLGPLLAAGPAALAVAAALAPGWTGPVAGLVRVAAAVAADPDAAARATAAPGGPQPAAGGTSTSWAWQAVSARPRLDMPRRLTLLAVAGRADAATPATGAGVDFDDLVDEVGVSGPTLRRYCRDLVAAGLLTTADDRRFALPAAASSATGPT